MDDDRHVREPNRKREAEGSNDGKEEAKPLNVLREPTLGPGIATALNTLRDKGELKQKFEWVGRTNDMKKVRHPNVFKNLKGGYLESTHRS